MTQNLRPANEADRLAALEEYAIWDSGPEDSFDAVTRIVQSIFGTPIAFISLINEDLHWTKAGIGYAGTLERDFSFCAHTILEDKVMVVPDARRDSRFENNPLVMPNDGIRFYAGAPLIVPGGHRLGTLCAVALTKKTPTSHQVEALSALANQVVILLELRRKAARLADSLTKVRTLEKLIPICAHCHKVRDDKSFWSTLDAFIAQQTGTHFARSICPTCADAPLTNQEDDAGELSHVPSRLDREQTFDLQELDSELERVINVSEKFTTGEKHHFIIETIETQKAKMRDLHALSERLVAVLDGIQCLGQLLPICARCQKVRNDKMYWSSLELQVDEKTESQFTHGICPDCVRKHYPEVAERILNSKE